MVYFAYDPLKGVRAVSLGFFALIARMKYIARWGLMRNREPENIQEHSHMVAVLAHALAVISRDVLGHPCDPDRCAAVALFHDASEIITGDLPTPIKYYNRELMSAYHDVEHLASKKLLQMLPVEMHSAYKPLLYEEVDDHTRSIVKAADKLSAYIKCVEERKSGNNEFLSAEKQTLAALKGYGMPEVTYFLDKFMPAFELNLDELGGLESEDNQ